jgi:hypothetical protein
VREGVKQAVPDDVIVLGDCAELAVIPAQALEE